MSLDQYENCLDPKPQSDTGQILWEFPHFHGHICQLPLGEQSRMGLFPRSLDSFVMVSVFDESRRIGCGSLALLLEKLMNKACRASLLVSTAGSYQRGPTTMGVVVIENNLRLFLSPSMWMARKIWGPRGHADIPTRLHSILHGAKGTLLAHELTAEYAATWITSALFSPAPVLGTWSVKSAFASVWTIVQGLIDFPYYVWLWRRILGIYPYPSVPRCELHASHKAGAS